MQTNKTTHINGQEHVNEELKTAFGYVFFSAYYVGLISGFLEAIKKR